MKTSYKAIIPVAGIGSRLRPQTHTQPKVLFPIAGKPILGHIIESLLELEINSFVFVIGYLGQKVKEYVDQHYPNINASYVEQENKEGAGHAIWLAKEHIKPSDPLLIVLGDTIIDIDLKHVLNEPFSQLGIKKVADPRQFGVVELAEDGFISKAIEKPEIPKSNLALVGIYKILEGEKLIKALDYIIQKGIKNKDQFYITDAIMMMLEDGVRMKPFTVDKWYDCGKKEILLETNAMLLSKQKKKGQYHFNNTIIIEPVSIPTNCEIKNSIIGPNVSIGENSTIQSSIITDSIIGAFSTLDSIVLNNSLIGSDATLKGMNQSLNLGDSTEISFS